MVYGAKLKKKDGAKVKAGELLAEWDPYTIPILTEVSGVVKFGDVIEGVTMEEKVDERTGLSTKVIIDSKDIDKRPRISIKDVEGQTARLPGPRKRAISFRSARISTSRKARTVFAGDVMAKIPRETTKTKDITGGLPRVAELFEARKPKEFAVITEIDGIGLVRQGHQGQAQSRRHARSRRAARVSDPQGQAHQRARRRPIRAGEALMDGSSNPHDILTFWARRRWPSIWSTKCRKSTASRACASTTSISR